MGFSKDITGYLPPEIAKLFKDDAAVKDMLVVLTETEKAVNAASKDPATSQTLRAAFNDVAGLLPIARSVVEKNGKVSFGDLPRIMGLMSNVTKYKALGQTLSDAFEAGDPAVVSLARNLAGNAAFIAALERVAPKTQTLERQALLADADIRSDLLVILTEMEGAIDVARKNPATEAPIKEALGNMTDLTSVAHAYLEKGSLSNISPDLMVEFALNKDKYSISGQTLSEAFKAGNPALVTLAQSVRENEKSLAALKRIVPKTHGELFRLEEIDGQGYAVELVSGGAMKFALKKADYDEIKSALEGAAEKPKPTPKQKPGQGPSV